MINFLSNNIKLLINLHNFMNHLKIMKYFFFKFLCYGVKIVIILPYFKNNDTIQSFNVNGRSIWVKQIF